MDSAIEREAARIAALLLEKHGQDVDIMDLRGVTDTADFFVLCTGTSQQHIRALTDELVEQSRAAGNRPWHVEGYETRRWVLVDFVDIVVHLFQREAREFYALERLWGDAPCRRVGDPDQPSATPPPDADVPTLDNVFSRPDRCL